MIREAKYSLVAALAVAVVLAVAPASAADPFDIPVILPLTGGGAFLGTSENQSLQLVEKMVNKQGGIKGLPVHFAVSDDQSNPQVAVQLTNGALAKKPPVIMGSAVVAMCNAMAAIVKANGPVQFCFSPGIHPVANSYTFSSTRAVRTPNGHLSRRRAAPKTPGCHS
jgi:branched-chain amino acid transport system substrate-binding protein